MVNSYKIRGTKVTSPYPTQLTPAETRLIFSLERIFPQSKILADLYLPKPDLDNKTISSNDDLTQIDCIVIDQKGIFVFESKDYSGWIYGHGNRQFWTQVLDFGREKNQFYNPVKQNQTHIAALKTIFDPETPIFSIIVFGRETTLKVVEDIPSTCQVCTQSNLRQMMQSYTQNLFTLEQITEFYQNLLAGIINPTTLVRETHIFELK